MFKVTTDDSTRTAATLRDVWIVAIYDGVNGSITLENPDESTQTFASYAAFTTYVEENA